MKLAEALALARAARSRPGDPDVFGLACGFTPLHLESFLAAHLAGQRPGARIELVTAPYGDLAQGLVALASRPLAGVAVVVEWADLDPRLGLRRLGGWSPAREAGLLETAAQRLAQLRDAVGALAGETRVVVCGPGLPLPPAFHTPTWQAGPVLAELRRHLAEFGAACAREPQAVWLDAAVLDRASPPAARHDVRSELRADFPYTRAHADALGAALARALAPPPPLKGLITDLDDTLWRGLVGEVGPAGVHFDLDGRSQVHALYQQLLQSLADAGVLLAVASKNDPDVVADAFARDDLLLRPDRLYPVVAGWGPKSEMVARILEAWNVGADAVAFVDDSPMELAEVGARFPELAVLRFPAADDAAAVALLGELRDRFGRAALDAEDALRLGSLRGGAALREAAAGDTSERFLEGLEAEVVLDFTRPPPDGRALELINKTNQFNLNGARLDAGEWGRRLADPSRFLLVAGYADKFGPLGRVAVLEGRVDGDRALLETWVMSCRAFARRIEHRCLEALFGRFGASRVELDYRETPRNGPLRDFLAGFVDDPKPGRIGIDLEGFRARCPALHHGVRVDG